MTPWSQKYDASFISWMDNCDQRKTKTNADSCGSCKQVSGVEQLIDGFNKKCPD